MKAKKSKKIIWEKQLARFSTLFPWYLCNYNYVYRLPKIIGQGASTYSSILKDEVATSYLVSGQFDQLAEIFGRRAKKDRIFLDRLASNYFYIRNDFCKIAELISKTDLAGASNKKSTRLLDYYCRAFLAHHPYASLCRMFDLTLAADLEKYLLEKINGRGKAAAYLSILVSPVRLSSEIKNELGILKIAKKISKRKKIYDFFFKKDVEVILAWLREEDPDINREFNELHKKFCWLPVFFDSPDWPKEFYIKEIKSWLKNKNELNKKYRVLSNYLADVKRQKKKIIKELNPPAQIKKLIKYAETFAFIKTELGAVFSYTSFKARPLFAEAASRAGWPVRDFRYLTPLEAKKFLAKNILPKRSLIKSRQSLSLICPGKGELIVLAGAEAERVIKEKGFLAKLSKEIRELKGQVANLGKARGRAKIIKSFKDIGKIKKGDILVAPITKPDLITGLKKVAAIVTDEGGLTCHAAIISRELKIPCVVGAKIATQVLRDGQLVEVDANKGIVKVLK
ncbi:MAG: PEP-utilizing enzyme [Patescibacteria group bacterium]|nr:PEP-utilizing enzyme [Patescibacteria group bacterium]MDD5295219.1 PEP-utilizing enzyme [Patescibacteria group bacterium]MDD5554594.1 PEP-utilizing enzyme [Patescibacteria group bacterium]